MVRIDPVWDSTTAVLARRAAPIALIAICAFLLPPAIQKTAQFGLGERSVAGALVGALLALVSAVAAIWGSLVVMALAADPPASLSGAARLASARLLPVIGVVVVITVAAMLLVVPILVALAASGADLRQMVSGSGTTSLQLSPSSHLSIFLVIYGVLLLVIAMWVSARLLLTNAVVLFERRGLGAIGRSVTLSRGSTWRLIGVLLLLVVTIGVGAMAAEFVAGTVAGAAMEGHHPHAVSLVGDVASAAVSALFLSVSYVFVARAYVFARDRTPARG